MLDQSIQATKSATERIAAAGKRMTLAVTAPLSVLGGLSLRAFASFDQALVQTTAIMHATAEEMAQMRQQALSLATRLEHGPTELARGYFQLAAAGKDAQQAMAL